MSEDKVSDILSAYQEKVNERRLLKLSKRVKVARAVTLFIAILFSVAFFAILYLDEINYLSVTLAVAFFILFFSSGRWPFISLAISSCLESAALIFSLTSVVENLPKKVFPEGTYLTYLTIFLLVRSIFITFLIRGTMAANHLSS